MFAAKYIGRNEGTKGQTLGVIDPDRRVIAMLALRGTENENSGISAA